jgi:hypothetical protein
MVEEAKYQQAVHKGDFVVQAKLCSCSVVGDKEISISPMKE